MKILRIKDVCARTGISRARIYQLMAEGKFPASVELGPNSVGWRERDVAAWLDARPMRSAKRKYFPQADAPQSE
jgi:prophage regulatory protein